MGEWEGEVRWWAVAAAAGWFVGEAGPAGRSMDVMGMLPCWPLGEGVGEEEEASEEM